MTVPWIVRRWRLVIAVVLAHALIVAGWPSPRRSSAARPAPIALRLIAAPTPRIDDARAATAAAEPTTLEPPNRMSARRPRLRAATAGSGPIAAPSLDMPATEATAAAATAASASAVSVVRPLDLSVHADPLQERRANPATADPRANTPRSSAAERMAQRLGADDRLTDEIRPDGSVRIRQGGSCYDARIARAAELDPMNASVRPAPRLVSACP